MISIIIPTYNESGNIKRLIKKIFETCRYRLEIIIVDDNSPDGTGKIAEELAKKYSITVIHRKEKLGLSTAVVEGFKAARGDILGVMDGDLSHPPEILPSLIKPIQDNKAELVIGSRYAKGGNVEVWPFFRKLTSLVATVLAKPLTPVKDPLSGLFFLRKKVIKGIRFRSKGYKIGLEILVKGNYIRVVEVPYTFQNRFVGKSKLGFKENYYYLKNLVHLYAYRLLRQKQ